MDITHHMTKIPPMNDVTHEHRFFSHESILHTIMRFVQNVRKQDEDILLLM
jgi:hypothetical protein